MNVVKFYPNILFHEMTKWNNQMIKLIYVTTHQMNMTNKWRPTLLLDELGVIYS